MISCLVFKEEPWWGLFGFGWAELRSLVDKKRRNKMKRSELRNEDEERD